MSVSDPLLQCDKPLPVTPRSSNSLPVIISNLTSTSPTTRSSRAATRAIRRGASIFSLPSLSSLRSGGRRDARSPVASPSRASAGRPQYQRQLSGSEEKIDGPAAEKAPSDRSFKTAAEGPAVDSELPDVDANMMVSPGNTAPPARPTGEHPGPLSSNPPTTCQNSEDGQEDDLAYESRPRRSGRISFGAAVQAKLDEIAVGGVDSIIQRRVLSQIYALDSAADSWSPPTPPSDSIVDFPPTPEGNEWTGNATSPTTRSPLRTTRGSTNPATLRAANTALLALRTAHEYTIAMHEATIAANERTIAELSRQLHQQAEKPNSANEDALLGEERWALLGRLAELQGKVAALEARLRLADRGDDDAKRKGFVGESMWRSGSDAGSFTVRDWSSPVTRGRRGSNGTMHSPDAQFAAPYSPPCSPPLCGDEPTMRGWGQAATPPSSTRGVRSIHAPPSPGGRVSLAAHLMVRAKQKSKLAKDSVTEDEELAAPGGDLDMQVGSRESPIQAAPPPVPIPDLPVLTYTKSSEVWLDRVTSAFQYHGLLEFIQRNSPQPDPSMSTAAELAAWSNRRLRAAVLLKNAVEDDILEDVQYLLRRRDKRSSTTSTTSSTSRSPIPSLTTEDPHRLLAAILTLRRVLPSSSSDLSWIDRISDDDFTDGVEGFASLVLCVDKRHGARYGTSADHYEALLPRIQENMARRFPELRRESVDGSPRKWLHASKSSVTVWMAKAVKRRQVGGES